MTLAFFGLCVVLAPNPLSPVEKAKARKRREQLRLANGGAQRQTFTEAVTPTLAPGSPLSTEQHRWDRDGTSARGGGGGWGGAGDVGARDGYGSSPHDNYEYTYAYEGGGEGDGSGGGDGGEGSGRYGEAPPRVTWRRDAHQPRTVGEIEQRAALQAGWSRARSQPHVLNFDPKPHALTPKP